MAITYKDINQLSQKSQVAGTEKLPVSDTQYITPEQIAALGIIGDGVENIVTLTNAEYQALVTKDPNTVYIVTDVDPGGGGGGGGDGTVTSVAMTVPTGLSVSGSPITTSGTLAVSLASGYSIPTTTKQSEWDGKADKVTSATNGNFAGLDSNGNLTDSGKKASDFQEALVSGTNIKTVNNQSLLGSGNIDAKDTLVVDYGSNQVWQDIVAAYSNNKAVYCKIDESPDVYLIPLTYLDTSDSAIFISPFQTNGYFIWATVNMSNSWDQGSFTLQPTLVSGTNIKTINNESILGSGNISVGGGGGDTSDCVHKTGDETVGGDKTFTDNIGVVDADHIVYSGGGGGGGFTMGTQTIYMDEAVQTVDCMVSGEPKAFMCIISNGLGSSVPGVLAVVGDSTGCHGVYTTGTQHNYSTGFSFSYSGGSLYITAPSGVVFADASYNLLYYYGSGTLTFRTSTVQPGSGITSVTFTGTPLTEMPAIWTVLLETQVNSESYRRVACAAYETTDGIYAARTFYSSQIADTTNSFSTSYNNGLNINSGGMNAGGYFHNPGTYTLYYLMASDVAGGGGGGFQSLGDELDDIRDTIGDIATILASI